MVSDAATIDAGGEARSRHAVDLRFGVPTPWGRVYLCVVGGAERRTPDRIAAEQAAQTNATPRNFAFVGLLAACSAAVAVSLGMTAYALSGGLMTALERLSGAIN